MSNNALALSGKWIVKVKNWTWEYIFEAGGKVSWRDPMSAEKGEGTWIAAPKCINISWRGSSTKESLPNPITPPNLTGWYSSPYYTGAYSLRKDISPPENPPTIGGLGDWFVTSFSGNTLSVVVAVGVTAFSGSIEFANANGTKVTKSIALYGPSIGLSYTPNIGKIAEKLPGAQQLMKRFPIIAKMITGKEEQFAERVLLYLWAKSPAMRSAVTAFPAVRKAIAFLVENRNAASGATESMWSTARGLVVGKGSTVIKQDDFVGQCVCYAVTGAFGPGNVGTYVIFFGLPSSWSPLSEPETMVDLMKLDSKSKGVAVISSASASLGLPSISAGATIFWGEIR